MRSSSITQVPLPEWGDIAKAFLGGSRKLENLFAPWIHPGDRCFPLSRSAWSMAVIARWRQRIRERPSITVWIPDFFCNESLSLLREMGTRLLFYPINDRGYPEWSNFPVVSEDNQPDLFLLVHYFGEPSPVDEAIAFCKRNKAWLLEDAAHVLMAVPGIGEAGDCVLYSPHKHLAIPDGALLVIRKNGPSALGLQDDVLRVLREVYTNAVSGTRQLDRVAALWLIKRMLQKLGFRSWKKSEHFGLVDQSGSAISEPPAMSILANRLLGFNIDRLPRLSAERARRAVDWERLLRSLLLNGGFRFLPTTETPYLACVAADDQGAIESLYTWFQSVGLPVTTWPDLAPEVVSCANRHTAAMRFRQTRIYLPVHQSVSSQQINALSEKMRDSMQDRWQVGRVESQEEWENLWTRCKRKSLPQTWEYGSAKASAEGWQAQRYVVYDEAHVPTALFQVLVKGLPVLGGAARVNRGPLMLRDLPAGDCRLALHAIAALMQEARRRRWWIVQIAPLLPPSDDVRRGLRKLGFRGQLNYPADSALLSLHGSEDELLMRLDGKWRNCLRKGQKLGVTVKLDQGGLHFFQCLLEFYKNQQYEKGFDGTSDKMLRALSHNQSKLYKFNLFVATEGSEITHPSVVGVLVTIQFGDISEYLIGATNDRGRAQQANSVLLWEAVLDAKRNGCRWFDVGGLSENTPTGIADFKKGLNPEPYALVGEWRKWF